MIARTTNLPPLFDQATQKKPNVVLCRRMEGDIDNAVTSPTASALTIERIPTPPHLAPAHPNSPQRSASSNSASLSISADRNAAPTERSTRLDSEGPAASQIPAAVLVCTSALLRESLSSILVRAGFCLAATGPSVDETTIAFPAEGRRILLILEVIGNESAVVAEIKRFKEERPSALIALFADHDQLSGDNVIAAFRFGANAYFVKPSCETFVKGLEVVMNGATMLPTGILPFFLDQLRETGPRAAERKSQDAEIPSVFIDAESVGGTGLTTAEPCALSPWVEVRSNRFVTQQPNVAKITDLRRSQLSERERCVFRSLVEGDSNKVIASKCGISEATVKVHVKAVLRKIGVSNRTQAAVWAMNHASQKDVSV
jgi:two-component system, NarL family, nitrate/nitrite response regulator NarL